MTKLGIVTLIVACLANASSRNVAIAADGDPPDVPVSAEPAKRADVPIYTRGIGTVQAFQSVLVRAQVTGYLTRIAFTEGQSVKAGDSLAEIDTRPYDAALAQAQARRAADQAQLQNDQVNLRRDAALAQKSFASRQQVDNDAALVSQFAANVQADDAAIATAQLNLEFCHIKAPIDGVVGLRMIDIGNLVQANGTQGIVQLNQVHPISVVFTLPQDQLPAVQDALARGKPQVDAFTSDGKTRLDTGELLTPSNQVDSATATISLKANFPNPSNRLWPGAFVNARLRLDIRHDAVTIPPAAVQHGPDGLYVYVVKPDQTVEMKPITVGYQDETTVLAQTGLQGGETVVTAGQSRLQTGTRVSVKAAAKSS